MRIHLVLAIPAISVLASCGTSSPQPDTRVSDAPFGRLDRSPPTPDGRPLADGSPKPDGSSNPDKAMQDATSTATYGPVTDPGRWAGFNLAAGTPLARGYIGVGLDGRYAYFVPLAQGGIFHGLIARYDTKADFGQASSWTTFDLASSQATGKICLERVSSAGRCSDRAGSGPGSTPRRWSRAPAP